MNSALTLEEQKARLVARCDAERAIVAASCDHLQQSMTWWEMGYSVASVLAPKVKFLLPVLAVAVGGSLGSFGKVGPVVAKAVTAWQVFQKARSVYQTLGLGSFFGRKQPG
jgi:hypothetical protein